MTASRAYTHIDASTIKVANVSIQRSWSSFMAQSFSLYAEKQGKEWLEQAGSETEMQVDGQRLGVMDFPEKSWSEAYSPFGAGVFLEQCGQGLRLITENIALHESPGLICSSVLRNTSRQKKSICAFCLDAWRMPPAKLLIHSHDFSQQHTSLSQESHERALAVSCGQDGLILGAEGGGRYDFFSPDPQQCAIVYTEEISLGPGESWQSPYSFVLPYQGSIQDVLGRDYAALLRVIMKKRTLALEQESAS